MSDGLIPLPEPAGFRMRYRSEPGMLGHYPWNYYEQRRRSVERPEHETEALYTADQMRAYAAAAVAAERERWSVLAANVRCVVRAHRVGALEAGNVRLMEQTLDDVLRPNKVG